MGRVEVLFGGQGGQGIKFVGTLLGQACARSGKQVASSASYGPEARGTLIGAEVVVAEEQITYPRTLNPQFFVALSQEAYDRLHQGVAGDGVVLFDPQVVTPSPEAPQRHYPIPALSTAAEMGQPGAANMIMLGALIALSGLVDLETVKKTLPESGRAINERALERGFTLGRA
ncbi:MAG: 2-oxoacid:acceptor oxidoreductase family protein [Anaerolineae bacterium]|nr:2-oxoacid:acceptor oxidoreductase family protein [Anaerolineae bacterium]MDH7474240.1 2-oxoacid:acceptor oxidoreductase family protein [Anaerolineae bacterium]